MQFLMFTPAHCPQFIVIKAGSEVSALRQEIKFPAAGDAPSHHGAECKIFTIKLQSKRGKVYGRLARKGQEMRQQCSLIRGYRVVEINDVDKSAINPRRHKVIQEEIREIRADDSARLKFRGMAQDTH